MPNVSTLISVVDPDVRLASYQRSIAAWNEIACARRIQLHILETSGAKVDDLLTQVRKNDRASIHFGAYEPRAEVSRGKGAIEFSAIAWYLKSRMHSDVNDSIFKATGRLILRNASYCVSPIANDSVRIRMALDGNYVDTRLLGGSSKVWSELCESAASNADDEAGIYVEHAVAAFVSSRRALKTLSVERFARRPLFEGVSGSTGKFYSPNAGAMFGAARTYAENRMIAISKVKQA